MSKFIQVIHSSEFKSKLLKFVLTPLPDPVTFTDPQNWPSLSAKPQRSHIKSCFKYSHGGSLLDDAFSPASIPRS